MVQKVSALYDAGITAGEYTGPSVGVATPVGSGRPALITGSTRLSGVSRTALSAKLAPPEKPKVKVPTGKALRPFMKPFMTEIQTTVNVLGVLSILPGLVFLISIVVGMAELALITGFIFGGLLLLIVVLTDKPKRLAREKWERECPALVAWRRACARWNQLYYCARDDGVFIPGQTRLIPVDRMRDFLYQG